MQNLFESLATRYPSAARCAAALGMSRQAYQQAQRRRHLSESKAMLAGVLLDITPSDALLLNATGKNPTPPKDHPAPNLTPEPANNGPENTNYANLHGTKKSAQCAPLENVHVITSEEQKAAIDLIHWVFAVAGLRADSPRFEYYVSRWRVPEKIAAAKNAGTFAEAIARCPPIDPAWVRFVPGALEAYRAFITPAARPPANTRSSSGNSRPARKQTRRAA